MLRALRPAVVLAALMVAGGAQVISRAEPQRKLVPRDLRVSDAQVERRIQTTVAWYTHSLVTAYEQHGRRHIRWDAPVRTGLSLAARSWAFDPARGADTDDQAWYHLNRAIALGCDDPLVEYVHARLAGDDLDRKEAARRQISAAMRLEQTTYPALVRGNAFLTGADALFAASRNVPKDEWDRNWKVLWALVDKSFDLLPEVLRDLSIPPQLVVAYVNAMTHQYADNIERDRQKLFDMIMAEVMKTRTEKDPIVPILRGWFYARYAWDARGHGFADSVKAENWPRFFERLDRAEAEAAKAVGLGSKDPAVARIMTIVATGLHRDREELDDWFEIGTRLEPGDVAWYRTKLDWLQPRWYGSDAELLSFAREVRRTGNWGIRAPLALIDAHELVAKGRPRAGDYFQQQDVCDEIASLYEDLLQRFPDAGYDRSQYALRLVNCGRWREADRQFRLLTPDRVRVGVFGGQEKYDAKRRLAAERSRPQP